MENILKNFHKTAKKLHQQFLDNGFTTGQAKLKSVWESPAIASICSHMPNMKLLQANTSAAVNETVLSSTDKQLMAQYAARTASGYCTGCAAICEQSIADKVPVSDIMRYLMYYSNYDNQLEAVRLFNDLPHDTRRRIAGADYSKAEQRCPQKMPIARLMKSAVDKLYC